jgi:CAAX prenyl protease-like protein
MPDSSSKPKLAKTLDRPPPPLVNVRDDWAYILPMAVFLAFVWLGGQFESWYPTTYVGRVVIVGVLLILFWRLYTPVRWNHWWLGVVVGVIGIFQWVGMQLFLQRHFDFFKPPENVFNPMNTFQSPAMLWSFIAVRTFGAVIVVPVMEELFWRDWLWRTILAPNDFKLAKVGEWDWKAFLIVTGLFATVHGNWWLTAIVWAAMVGALLVYTKSLGACILAHATTNLLLAAYVLYTKDWAFW